MTTPLINYYTGFLESTGAVIDQSTGVVSYERSTGLKPVLIDGKELILPIRAFQDKPDWTRYVPFHPLSESIARGESEVLQKAKELISLKLFLKYAELSEALLMLAVNSESQAKLTPTQMKFLEGLGDADEKTVENFSKILAKSKATFEGGENRCLVSLFLKRGGTLNGQKFARLCVVAFPYYEALCKIENEPADKRVVFGVPLRAKDIKVLKRLHEVIVPNSDDGIYSIGTNVQTAPYWGALMMTYVNILNQFNSVIKPFSKVIKSLKAVDTSWDVGDELQQFRAEIPPMPYNEGADSSKPAETTQPLQTQQQPVATQPQTIPQPTGNLVQQPATIQQAPSFNGNQNQSSTVTHPPAHNVKPSNGGGVNFADAMNKSGMGMMPQMQMPGMMPQMYPQQGYPQQQMPMYPQQQMYPQMQMQMPMQQLPMPPVSQPQGQQQFPQQMYYQNGQLPMPPVSQQQQQGYPQQGMYPQQQMMQPQMYPQMQMPGMMPQMQMPGMMQQGYPQQPQMFQFGR
ncbi:hypothetical protein RAY_245 [Erwinia phage vB_EamM_RAY]|uniref:Uncharacterized protein n=6 Tax=Agricanvirus TaxID=1984776 RepID=A0A173GEQ7_9CAUD|nr:hypothetical protein FDH98_gp273 [Erwinia phage vB_EamM_RAY]YP_009606033.1 hypothetical protein FDH99_gp276 [Erwinia phage vB_EamM_Simmy50]YP_009606354.1 hypothetical protein FDI00_gp248 [Erwinia phage vB_EamM_Special G]YP_009621987.1 hypothetical protein FDJ23_gp246 [Erwinia phage vB_EamM_Desertfox]AUG86676.1 hypothetical protein MADMEL_249 [Erwinia phage vB_EamM_MadMel]QBP07352.1 hypothetical protein REBECCA_247 [Erwinia phage Rebecca]ANH51709.1 hypothetical protein SIMMY50_250 [Erwinia 